LDSDPGGVGSLGSVERLLELGGWLVVAVTVGLFGGTDVSTEVRFDGQVALVTGAGRGLGREFALLLARRGARVVVNDVGLTAGLPPDPENADPAVAEAVVQEIRSEGGEAVPSTTRVGSEQNARLMISETLDSFGRLDILINNAGTVYFHPFDATTSADLDDGLDVHVRGPFFLSQSAWPHMRGNGGGRILNVGSAAGVLFGQVGKVPYEIGKAGLAALTRVLAVEGAPVGIRANMLLPSARTQMKAAIRPDVGTDAHEDPGLVAPGACWLVHPDCPATGQIFHAGGGRMSVAFMAIAEGVQLRPQDVSLEAIRRDWQEIEAMSPFEVPATAEEFMAFRSRMYLAAMNPSGR